MSSVKFNWNVFPSTKLEESQMSTPLGCMFTPFEESNGILADIEPMSCSSCGSFVNPHIRIDRQNNMWWCPVCSKTTFFPDSFKLHEPNSPPSKISTAIRPTMHNTVDFVLPSDISVPSRTSSDPFIVVYLFDAYQNTDTLDLHEFMSLKQAMATSISQLPPSSLVLLVSVTDKVEVHAPESKKSAIFTPEILLKNSSDNSFFFKDEFASDVTERLSFSSSDSNNLIHTDYLSVPGSKLTAYIDSLMPTLTQSYKAPRAMGLAWLVTTIILSKCTPPNSCGKIMCFLSGPTTLGPGKVVSEMEHMRSHREVANFAAPYFSLASKFYKALACILAGYKPEDAYSSIYSTSGKLVDYSVSESTSKFSVDLYTGSLDQVGVYEMKSLADSNGGAIILTDSFASLQFVKSLYENTARIAEDKHLCKLSVVSSPGIKIMKSASGGTELQSSYQAEKHSALHHEKISDTITKFDSSLSKRNFTNQWYLGCVSHNDTLALFFEMNTASSSSALNADLGIKEIYIQFQLRYWDMKRQSMMLRVTTIRRPTTLAILADNQVKLSNGKYKLVNMKGTIMKEKLFLESFNYQAWISLFTRLLIRKIDTTLGFESFDEVVDEVDFSLIRILKFFGGIKVNSGQGANPYENLQMIYSMSPQFKELPALAYDLRRNPQLIRIFNSSPDETAFNHHVFFRCNSEQSCRMISPVFFKVEKEDLVQIPSTIDSIENNSREPTYYVLDCVCHIIIFYNFSDEKDKLPLHNSNNSVMELAESNEEFGRVFSLVKSKLSQNRPVVPKWIVTMTGHSQARFLYSRLHPRKSTNKQNLEDESESKQKTSWWSLLLGIEKSVQSNFTDDMSLSEFYEELLKKVKNYSTEADK